MHQHIAKAVETVAPVATYGGSGAALVSWGLHIGDVCAIISTLVAVLGFGLQCWAYWRKNHPR